jgi:hypothetical protein
MNTANCHSQTLACDPPKVCAPKTLPSTRSLILLTPRVLTASLAGAAEVIQKTFEGGYPDTCAICRHHHDKQKSCCDIPETNCPSPYVCRILWEGCPGDTFKYQLQVTNTSDIEREFNLIPSPFLCTEEAVTVTPDNKKLLPDQSLNATISFTIPDTFGGGLYRARIKVAGAYAQFITINLTVADHQDCCCSIEQGEIPTRLKAHQWFDHFQCEEQCFEPIEQEDKER